jgi:hypothetical protein
MQGSKQIEFRPIGIVKIYIAAQSTFLFFRRHALPMHKIALFPLIFVQASAIYVPSPVHVPFATATVKNLGLVSDPASNPVIFHDGGGGASQNGYHVQVFADSDTTSSGFNFVHNSVAYYGFVCSRPKRDAN